MAKKRRSKRIYYCVVMPTRNAKYSMGAVFGCTTDPKKARQRQERGINRGMRGLRIDTTFSPPKGYAKWLPPTD